MEDAEIADIVRDLTRRAVKVVFDERCADRDPAGLVEAFESGWNVEVSSTMPSQELLAGLDQLAGLREAAVELAVKGSENPNLLPEGSITVRMHSVGGWKGSTGREKGEAEGREKGGEGV